ncbi:hypothetical protein [uncultured Ruegeria sp.]|uniref:hypothetical protein n=1 Tax=uncultured Ruegeria sp. TaxID=259304 RepID=UPI0026336315|nr:hypothetical protein [uncultured Ruegeria sp.]
MARNWTDEECKARLAAMTRPQRLILKRAYSAYEARPLQMEGPHMARAGRECAEIGYCKWVEGRRGRGVVLTPQGHTLAVYLMVRDWPDCERVA